MNPIVEHASTNPSPQKSLAQEVGRVIEMVGAQAMEGLSESQENMRDLLRKLEDLVNQRRKKIHYNYWDYEKKLHQSDEMFEKILQEKVLYSSRKWLRIGKKQSEVGELYFKIISLFPENTQELAEKRIQEEYLADLVLKIGRSKNENKKKNIGCKVKGAKTKAKI
ncbi:hypothetical protein CSB09_02545 [Candidatus Gracilibacteria bacterium]|nr:MAG: hypothetical protein CSB09_02545 [Candidatus Gracilibacteria bacterium]